MHTVSVEHAKAHLDELLEEAVHGEAVAILVRDDVVVRWMVERKTPALESAAGGWPLMGLYAGKMVLPEGWDADLPLDTWDALKS